MLMQQPTVRSENGENSAEGSAGGWSKPGRTTFSAASAPASASTKLKSRRLGLGHRSFARIILDECQWYSVVFAARIWQFYHSLQFASALEMNGNDMVAWRVNR